MLLLHDLAHPDLSEALVYYLKTTDIHQFLCQGIFQGFEVFIRNLNIQESYLMGSFSSIYLLQLQDTKDFIIPKVIREMSDFSPIYVVYKS